MEKILITHADCADIYSIEEYCGKKQIHFWGYFYHGDNWCSMECVGFVISLEEFVNAYAAQATEAFDRWYMEAKLYQKDFNSEEEAQAAFDNYFGETVFPVDKPHAPIPLPLGKVTLDTPCGDYIDM